MVGEAIGEKLGQPQGVSVRFGDQAFDDNTGGMGMGGSRGRIENLQEYVDSFRADRDPGLKEQEATDVDPGNLGIRVYVAASFAMAEK